jgi:predicted O-linked N-acetylglucosamine transferase (SPINDLY family)
MKDESSEAPHEEARRELSLGNYRASAALYAKALAARPESPALHFEIGMLSCLLGDFQGALGFFQMALRFNQDFVPALRGAASILLWKQSAQGALELAEKLLQLEKHSPDTHHLLARVYGALGCTTQQRASLEKAGQYRSPSEICSDTNTRLGEAHRADERSFEQWLEYGRGQRKTGSLSKACEAFRSAMERDPMSADSHLQLGITLALLGRGGEAESCLRNAARLDPQNAEAHSRLGAELLSLGKTDEGLAALKNALTLNPDAPETLKFIGAGLMQSGRQDEGVAVLRRAVELQPENAPLRSQLLAALNYIPVADQASRFEEFRKYSALFEEPVLRRQASGAADTTPRNFSPDPNRRIRIGYVSGDFRNHSVAFFFEPLLKHHNRKRFEVFCYMTRMESDAVTSRLRSMAEHWREVASLNTVDFAARVRADGVDVLIDLASHTAENKLEAFAHRPAPVQVTMIGLMQTTGLRSMDYRITDALLDPVGESANFSSEKLWRLESGPLVFAPPADAPEVNALPATAGAQLVLACTNELQKVTPAVSALWARVLKALPHAKLLFFGRPGNRLASELGGLGIPADRLLEQRRLPLREFLSMHHRIDLALDPFPYNGLTVTLLSGWMGVPCVTLEGKSPPERAAGSLMRRFGLPEFVAGTEEEYLQKTVSLASNLPRLAEVRQSMRGRVSASLCDATRHVAELEAAFVQMLADAATSCTRAI